jgi:hypothetical protein
MSLDFSELPSDERIAEVLEMLKSSLNVQNVEVIKGYSYVITTDKHSIGWNFDLKQVNVNSRDMIVEKGQGIPQTIFEMNFINEIINRADGQEDDWFAWLSTIPLKQKLTTIIGDWNKITSQLIINRNGRVSIMAEHPLLLGKELKGIRIHERIE